ncbi:MAG: hypothetical protein A3F16_06855 [Deltaproteobacteria bacterium RIFCSPHIGHO2_12_FULL_43_9]|nr:MAG: hypothetical protein A3F16_06855 [Deltaproteobacteria bacterium RIFCSPHIGHO2_12_FULL_43_9]
MLVTSEFSTLLTLLVKATFIYFIAINSIQLILILIAWIQLKIEPLVLHRALYYRLLKSKSLPPITIIMPAYNEGATIVRATKYLLFAEYPLKEVIVVNDGSDDDSIPQLIKAFSLHRIPVATNDKLPSMPVKALYRSQIYPTLLVIDKERGGKSDALNVGIGQATTPYICTIDADSLLENDALIKIALPALTSKKQTDAVGGVVRLVKGTSGRIGRIESVSAPKERIHLIQALEYLRAFIFGRLGFSAMNALLIISGAFGLFRRDLLIKVGGFRIDQLGEDMELILRFHENLAKSKVHYSIRLVPDTVCWTVTPSTISALHIQRRRWQMGLAQALWTHKGMFLNPRNKLAGLFAFPYYVILELFGPFFELFAYLVLPLVLIFGIIDVRITSYLLLAMIWYTISVSLLTISIEQLMIPRFQRVRDLMLIAWGAVLEVFLYRPLNHLWRVEAMFGILFAGRKSKTMKQWHVSPLTEYPSKSRDYRYNEEQEGTTKIRDQIK